MSFAGFAWVSSFGLSAWRWLSVHSDLGPWSEHGTQWYSCNRYDEKAGIDARDAQSRSRASLERYLHVRLTLSDIVFG